MWGDITPPAGVEEESATGVLSQKSWLVFGKLCFEKLAEVLGLQMGKDNPAGLLGLRNDAVQDLLLEGLVML